DAARPGRGRDRGRRGAAARRGSVPHHQPGRHPEPEGVRARAAEGGAVPGAARGPAAAARLPAHDEPARAARRPAQEPARAAEPARLLRQARPAREGGARAHARGDGRPLRGARRLTSGAGIASDALPSAREVVMAIRIVRLGTPRARGEGLRVGTVRHPPRGVPKRELAKRDYYDVWLPELAASA